MKSKKAAVKITLEFLLAVIFIIAVFWGILGVYEKFWDTTSDISGGGEACRTTLVAKSSLYTDKEIGYGFNVKFDPLQNYCSTNNNILEIERSEVQKPRDNISNQAKAGLKYLATRLTYVWAMTGNGKLGNLWATEENKDQGPLSVYFGKNSDRVNNKCVTFMNIDIKDSKYFPKPRSADNGELVHPLNYISLSEYLREERMDKPIIINGEKKYMTYYQYLTLSGGPDSGTLVLLPSNYETEKTYSIALMQIPQKEAGFLELFAVGCGSSVLFGTATVWSLKLAAITTIPTGGIGTLIFGALATGTGYLAYESGSTCLNSGATSVEDYYTYEKGQLQIDEFEEANPDITKFSSMSDDVKRKLENSSMIILGPQRAIQALGCVEIEAGVTS